MYASNVLCLFHCATAVTGREITSIDQFIDVSLFCKIINVPSDKCDFKSIKIMITDYFNNKLSNVFNENDSHEDVLVKMLLLSIVVYILQSNDGNKHSILMELCEKIPRDLHANACAMFAPVIMRLSDGDSVTHEDLERCLKDGDKENKVSYFSPIKTKDRQLLSNKRNIRQSIKSSGRDHEYNDNDNDNESQETSTLVNLVKYVQSPDYQTKKLMKFNRDLGKSVNELEHKLFMTSNFEIENDKTLGRWKEKCLSLDERLKQAHRDLDEKEEQIIAKDLQIEKLFSLYHHNKRLEEKITDYQDKISEVQLLNTQCQVAIEENKNLKIENRNLSYYYSLSTERQLELEDMLDEFEHQKEMSNELSETKKKLSTTEARLTEFLSEMQRVDGNNSRDCLSEASFNDSFYNPEPLSIVVEKERDELIRALEKIKEETISKEMHSSIVEILHDKLSNAEEGLVKVKQKLASLIAEDSEVILMCRTLKEEKPWDAPVTGTMKEIKELSDKHLLDVIQLKETISTLSSDIEKNSLANNDRDILVTRLSFEIEEMRLAKEYVDKEMMQNVANYEEKLTAVHEDYQDDIDRMIYRMEKDFSKVREGLITKHLAEEQEMNGRIKEIISSCNESMNKMSQEQEAIIKSKDFCILAERSISRKSEELRKISDEEVRQFKSKDAVNVHNLLISEGKLGVLQKDYENAMRNFDGLKVEYSKLSLDNDNLTDNISVMTVELDRMMLQKGDLQGENDNLDAVMDSLLTSITYSLSKINKLDINSVTIRDYQTDVEYDRNKLEGSLLQISQLELANKDYRNKVQKLQDRIDILEETSRSNNDLVPWQTRLVECEERNSKLQHQVDDLMDKLELKCLEIMDFKASIRSFETVAHSLKCTIEEGMKDYEKITDESTHVEYDCIQNTESTIEFGIEEICESIEYKRVADALDADRCLKEVKLEERIDQLQKNLQSCELQLRDEKMRIKSEREEKIRYDEEQKEDRRRHTQEANREHRAVVASYCERIEASTKDVTSLKGQLHLLTEEYDKLVVKDDYSKSIIEELSSKLDRLQSIVWNHTENEQQEMMTCYDEKSLYTRMSLWTKRPHLASQLPPVSRIDTQMATTIGLRVDSKMRFESYVVSPYNCEDESSIHITKEVPMSRPFRQETLQSFNTVSSQIAFPVEKDKNSFRHLLSKRIRQSFRLDSGTSKYASLKSSMYPVSEKSINPQPSLDPQHSIFGSIKSHIKLSQRMDKYRWKGKDDTVRSNGDSTREIITTEHNIKRRDNDSGSIHTRSGKPSISNSIIKKLARRSKRTVLK